MEGYKQKEFNCLRKRYCRTMDLKASAELIKEYRNRHSQGQVWKEILEGIRQVGILEMEIYIHSNRLFMIVETPLDFSWEAAMEQLSALPRQQEWERYMSIFQDCSPEASATQKWQMMERMFYLYE